MKVLKRPKSSPKKPWKKVVTCRGDELTGVKGCSAKLEINEKDLKLFHFFGTHFKHTYLSVKCPFCGAIIQKLSLPQYVYDRWENNHPHATQSEFDGFSEMD